MYTIPHAHPHRESSDDHHPISVGEIRKLLDILSVSTDIDLYADILGRLEQGIQGWMCPSPLFPIASLRMRVLENYLRHWFEYGIDDERKTNDAVVNDWVVRQFDLLINEGNPQPTDSYEVIFLYRDLA